MQLGGTSGHAIRIANSNFSSNVQLRNYQVLSGGYLHVHLEPQDDWKTPQILISNTTFMNGLTNLGGAVSLLGPIDIEFRGVSFIYNRAFMYGGAVFANPSGRHVITFTEGANNQRNMWSRNIAGEYGSNIYVKPIMAVDENMLGFLDEGLS